MSQTLVKLSFYLCRNTGHEHVIGHIPNNNRTGRNDAPPPRWMSR